MFSIYVIYITSVMTSSLLQTQLLSSSHCSVSEQCRRIASKPNKDNDVYSALGDLNIAGYITAPSHEDPNFHNLTNEFASLAVQMSEAISYAVKLVNEDPRLLPNVTLGFVLVNDGLKPNVALANTFQFLPHITYKSESDSACFCSSCSVPGFNNMSTDHHRLHYDIIGAISPIRSSITESLSHVFSAAKIPLISSMSSSDKLSDKSNHPYFLRVTPPNMFQTDAMLKFIKSNGWSYISVLYSSKPFGEEAYKSIRKHSSTYKICIATSHNVQESTDSDNVVNDLLKHIGARVVILLAKFMDVIPIFDAVDRRNATGTFIWIGGDAIMSSIGNFLRNYDRNLVGAFMISYHAHSIPILYQHISKLRFNSTTNPWLKRSWELLKGCSFSKGSCNNDFNSLDISDFVFINFTSLYVDAVLVFAHAATKLLADICPGRTGAEARACITGQDLLKYMKNVSFEGYSGRIKFDEHGDPRGQYNIWQIGTEYKNTSGGNSSSVYGLVSNTIALYNIKTQYLTYTRQKISWDHMSASSRTVHHLINSRQQPVAPESVCSKPCLPGEYSIYMKLNCCWECRKCRENERIVNNNTECEECEPFTWPDPETRFTTCQYITMTSPLLNDPVALILISLGVLAAVCAVIVSVGFVLFRHSPIIKASSRELSFLQLVAFGVGCVTVILLQLPPSGRICGILYFTFCLSFTWLYSPLLVKSVRIYRIFLGSSKHHRNPRFTSWYSQVVMAMILIWVQIILCLATYIIYKPAAYKIQPDAMEKYTEVACDMTLPGLVSFLTYNLILVFTCSVLAFKTRKLPDNFNESWLIFMCVATNLVIWLGFVPTYFTATRASVKSLMLSLALLLNHIVVLVFLFIPKIYKAVYTPAEVKPPTTFQHYTQQSTSKINQVAPSQTIDCSVISFL